MSYSSEGNITGMKKTAKKAIKKPAKKGFVPFKKGAKKK